MEVIDGRRRMLPGKISECDLLIQHNRQQQRNTHSHRNGKHGIQNCIFCNFPYNRILCHVYVVLQSHELWRESISYFVKLSTNVATIGISMNKRKPIIFGASMGAKKICCHP